MNAASTKAPECVIVLHGLARTRFAMDKLASALKEDYQVINNTYPSRKYPIETLAEMAITPALEQCQEAPRVHFVTHSMGGILVRQFCSQHTIKNMGHVVMLGPPNSGSELVDIFQTTDLTRFLFKTANGPASEQLSTQPESIPMRLGAVNFSLGVIAGNVSLNPIFSPIFEGEDDGKVSVIRSKIEGMKDHIVMPTNHTFMMRNDNVIKQVKHYLHHGKFQHGTNE